MGIVYCLKGIMKTKLEFGLYNKIKMNMSFGERLKHAWNVFLNRDPTYFPMDLGTGYFYRPDRPRFSRTSERTIISSIYNRIAVDASTIEIKHIKLDDNDRFLSEIDSDLNRCLNLRANADQTGRAFLQDVVMSLLDEGSVAIVPVDTSFDPDLTDSYKIFSMRVGKITDWYPSYIKVKLYNEKTGEKREVLVPKSSTAIIENPFYSVMNEPNSTMQRLIRKLGILDVIDEQSGSGKKQAEERRRDIENQLSGSKYGIAYTDGTERITQLNRGVENNLMSQIEYLTNMLFSQLGITQSILDGTADEQTMLNYYNRTIEPIVSAIVDEMKCKFLSQTARTRKQTIKFFRDPFKIVPVNQIADISDKLTRNEIVSSNEIRQVIGMKPSDDPSADELRNKNLNRAAQNEPPENKEEEIQNGV